ncbi:BON domain-containing protein [Rhodobacter sp. NSM]|uniref:BON domain-containing protein n=1 Tax=Rhodobacter sp. NSM TaxID=3457501 RepID=UPI003FD56AED
MAQSKFETDNRGWSEDRDTQRYAGDRYREDRDEGYRDRGGMRASRDERERYRDRFDARYQDRGQEDDGSGSRDRGPASRGMDAASGYGFGAAGFDPRDRDAHRGGYGAQERDYGRGYDPYSERRPQDEQSWSYGRQSGRGWDQRGRGHGERFGHPSDERGFMERAADEVRSWMGDDDASRRREADHRGKGPRGYQRSDERIHDDVNDRLSEDPRLDASDIEVSVASGEVTLSGQVSSKMEKRRAEDCTDSVSGVRHVQNNLRVRDGTGASGSGGSTFGAGSSGGSDTDSGGGSFGSGSQNTQA